MPLRWGRRSVGVGAQLVVEVGADVERVARLAVGLQRVARPRSATWRSRSCARSARSSSRPRGLVCRGETARRRPELQQRARSRRLRALRAWAGRQVADLVDPDARTRSPVRTAGSAASPFERDVVEAEGPGVAEPPSWNAELTLGAARPRSSAGHGRGHVVHDVRHALGRERGVLVERGAVAERRSGRRSRGRAGSPRRWRRRVSV